MPSPSPNRIDPPARAAAPRLRYSSTAERISVLVGVFFTFMPMGLIGLLIPANAGNWTAVICIAGFAGLSAVCWASAFIFSRRWLIIFIAPAQFLVPRYVFPWLANHGYFHSSSGLSVAQTRAVMASAAIVSIVIGYILLVRLARAHERRSNIAQAELDVARRIHESLVPPIDFASARVRILGRSLASSEMGGDLVDLIHAHDDPDSARTDIFLADVSGHGVGAGIVMSMVKSAIRMRLRRDAPLEDLVRDLNVVLADLTEPGMFATFACVRIDARAPRAGHAPTNSPTTASETDGLVARFALAGHLPIFLFRAHDKSVTDLPNDALPLGVDADETFSAGRVSLRPGDTLAVFTDGLMEVRSPSGQELGLDALRAHFADHAALPLEQLHDRLMTLVRSHGTQSDDQTLVLIRALA